MATKRRRFSKEFKDEAIKLVLEQGKTIGQAAVDLGIWQSSLRKWVEQEQADRGNGKPGALTTAERAELVELRKKVRVLEMERSILKKATAFFAKENA